MKLIHTNFVNTEMGLEMGPSIQAQMMLTLVGITACFLTCLYPAPFLELDSNKNNATINLLNMGAQLITFSKIRIVVKRKVLSYQNWYIGLIFSL